jgi:hypothetical protein
MTDKKIIKVLIITSVVVLFISLFTPLIFTQSNFSTSLDFSDTGEIGDTIGGIMNPFLTIVGILITFLAFYIQYSANNAQIKRLEKAENSQIQAINQQHFFRIADNLNQKITTFNTSTKQGYEALNQIIEELDNDISNQCFQLGRRIICYNPEVISNDKWEQLEEELKRSRHYLDILNLKDEIFKRNENERWEYLKRFIHNEISNNGSQIIKIVTDISTINFYKIEYDMRLFVYETSFENIEKKYSGFINSYFKNLLFLLKFIRKNNSDEFYLDYLIGNISLQELILTFYYSAYYKSGNEFRKLLKENNILNDLLKNRGKFIDWPSENDLKSEINIILNKTV